MSDVGPSRHFAPPHNFGRKRGMAEAMGKFALAYADQAERDHAVLEAAGRKGKITASQGS
jgi:hypothetical protein